MVSDCPQIELNLFDLEIEAKKSTFVLFSAFKKSRQILPFDKRLVKCCPHDLFVSLYFQQVFES